MMITREEAAAELLHRRAERRETGNRRGAEMTDKVRIGIYIGGAGIPDASDMPYCNGMRVDLPENWLSLPEDERHKIAQDKCAMMMRGLVNWFDERLAAGSGK